MILDLININEINCFNTNPNWIDLNWPDPHRTEQNSFDWYIDLPIRHRSKIVHYRSKIVHWSMWWRDSVCRPKKISIFREKKKKESTVPLFHRIAWENWEGERHISILYSLYPSILNCEYRKDRIESFLTRNRNAFLYFSIGYIGIRI